MHIGLISDTHIPEARSELWPQVFEAFRDVELILHGGDIYELGLLDELERIAPVHAARGNGEDGSGGRRPIAPDDRRLKEVWLLELGGLKVGLTHELPVPEVPPMFTVERYVKRLFPTGAPDVLVYGDTHVEEIGVINGILCVNPGSPTYPHGLEIQFGTIGFLDIENGQASASIWRITPEGIEPFDWSTWPRPR